MKVVTEGLPLLKQNGHCFPVDGEGRVRRYGFFQPPCQSDGLPGTAQRGLTSPARHSRTGAKLAAKAAELGSHHLDGRDPADWPTHTAGLAKMSNRAHKWF